MVAVLLAELLADHGLQDLADGFDVGSFVLGMIAGAIVLRVFIEVGERVDPGRPVMTLSQAIVWVWRRAWSGGG